MIVSLKRDQKLDRNKGTIIELYGSINCGKKILGTYLAKKLRVPFFGLPNFSIYDLDFEFFRLIKNRPDILLSNPDKWVSLYRSFLLQYHKKIQEKSKTSIVVTTNYLRSLKFYSQICEEQHWKGIDSVPIIGVYCTSDLPFTSDLDYCGGASFQMWNKINSIPKVEDDMVLRVDSLGLQLEFEEILDDLYKNIKRKIPVVNNDLFETPEKILKSIKVIP